jgi:SAM-dependent methyltransferase
LNLRTNQNHAIEKDLAKYLEKYYRSIDNSKRYSIEDRARTKELQRVVSAYNEYFGRKVLDIGCGGGILAHLLGKGHEYTGIDANRDMIRLARAHAPPGPVVRFILGDARRYRFKGEFDTIAILGNTLCHFNTKGFLDLIDNVHSNSAGEQISLWIIGTLSNYFTKSVGYRGWFRRDWECL